MSKTSLRPPFGYPRSKRSSENVARAVFIKGATVVMDPVSRLVRIFAMETSCETSRQHFSRSCRSRVQQAGENIGSDVHAEASHVPAQSTANLSARRPAKVAGIDTGGGRNVAVLPGYPSAGIGRLCGMQSLTRKQNGTVKAVRETTVTSTDHHGDDNQLADDRKLRD